MASNRDLQELVRLYGKAQDATQELSFCVTKLPDHFKACGSDVKCGKPASVENINYLGMLLKARASAALKAIGALHAMAAATFPDQAIEQEDAA